MEDGHDVLRVDALDGPLGRCVVEAERLERSAKLELRASSSSRKVLT